jgi:hypothetical protein
MNRLMRPTLLTFVVSLVGCGLIAVWDEDPRAVASWMLMWQRIALDVAIVSGLVMLALLVYAAWERLRGGTLERPSQTDGATVDELTEQAKHLQLRVGQVIVPVLKVLPVLKV